jgi:hypothetical protein
MGQFNGIEHLASTLSYLYDSDTKNSTFNGAPPVILAIDEATTKLFATTTREAFVGVTGTYTDFPDNSTSIIKGTNTLGVAHDVPVPFTFGATTVLFFNRECEISKLITKVLLVDDSTLTDNTDRTYPRIRYSAGRSLRFASKSSTTAAPPGAQP